MSKIYIWTLIGAFVVGCLLAGIIVGRIGYHNGYGVGYEDGKKAVPQSSVEAREVARTDTIKIKIRQIIRDTLYQSDPDQQAQITELEALISALSNLKETVVETVKVEVERPQVRKFGLGVAGGYIYPKMALGGVSIEWGKTEVVPMAGYDFELKEARFGGLIRRRF